MNLRPIFEFVERYYVALALVLLILFGSFLVAQGIDSRERVIKCVELGGQMLTTHTEQVCAKLTLIEIGK